MNTAMLANMMGSMGRGGDDVMAHLSHGDVVIPRDIVLQNPEFLTKFKKAMEDNQADYRGHVVGSGYENHNPETGAPEYFFNGLKSFFQKAMQNPIATLGSIALAPMTGGLSLATGAGYIANQPRKGSGDLAPSAPAAAPAYAPPPMAIASTPTLTAPNQTPIDQPFAPKRGAEPTKPFDLFSREVGGQQFSTLDPTQQRSYLATQGTQGGGIGDEDKNYYLGLLKRNLIDESGQLANMNNSLLPIERNYLSRLGLPTDNTTDFFQALQS